MAPAGRGSSIPAIRKATDGHGEDPGSRLLSVIVTAYNAEPELAECFASLSRQEDKNYELLAIDDCSPLGGCIERLLDLSGAMRRRYVRHERNRGVAAARNTGITLADGEYVVCVDGDDALAPGFVRRVKEAIRDDQSSDLLITDSLMFDTDPGQASRIVRSRVPEPAEITRVQPFLGVGIAMRRQWLLNGELYDECDLLRRGMEDREFLIRSLHRNPRIYRINEALYLRRKPVTSRSAACRDGEHELRRYIVRKNKAIFDSAGRSGEFLALGFLNSFEARWRDRRYLESAVLLVSALRHDWHTVLRRGQIRLRSRVATILRLRSR